METHAQHAFMQAAHHQLIGLAIYVLVQVTIVAVRAPQIRRVRRSGDLTGARQQTAMMGALIGAVLVIAMPLILVLR